MRMLYKLVFVGLLLPCLWVAAGDRLRLVSLNAEWFPGRVPEPSAVQRSRHKAGLQRFLHDVDPDVLLLQEIVCTNALEKTLAVLPDMEVYTMSAFAGNLLQLAIAGRLPKSLALAQGWSAPSDADAELPPRGLAYAALQLPDGDALLVFTLHLKSNWRGDEEYDEKQNVNMREQAISQFLDVVDGVEHRFESRSLRGIVLGGDLNTTYPYSPYRHEQTLQRLQTGGFVHLGSHGLDQFWGKGITNGTFSVFADYAVSDHAPIILDLELRTGESLTRIPPLDPATLVAASENLRTDLNRASRSELMSLPTIGPVLAQRIIEGRPFGSVDEMVDVCGVGPMTLARIKPHVEVIPVEN